MSKDGKKDMITPIAETSFGPVMMPRSECMFCFASDKYTSCNDCQFKHELMKAGLEYMKGIKEQIIRE